MKGYKFISSDFATDVLKGKVKLSLLSHFRKLERKDSLIPDKMEGRAIANIDGRFGPGSGSEADYERLKQLRILLHPGFNNNFIGAKYIMRVEELYVLSLSDTSENQSLSNEGNDAVILFKRLLRIGALLRDRHSDLLGEVAVGRVKYMKRQADFRDEGLAASAFIKGEEFAPQREVRVIWRALKSDRPFFITDCPEISEHLDRIR